MGSVIVIVPAGVRVSSVDENGEIRKVRCHSNLEGRVYVTDAEVATWHKDLRDWIASTPLWEHDELHCVYWLKETVDGQAVQDELPATETEEPRPSGVQ